MGLAERRAIKEFQDKHLPKLKAEIDKAAGFDVPLEVNWDQLAVEGSSHQIGRDDMGRDALKGGLKKIDLRNAAGNSSPGYAITFQEKSL